MADHKRQHYVPQSYLRNFAVPSTDEKAVRALRVEQWKHIDHASIATACQVPYFYGRDLVVERELQRIEGAAAPVIQAIIDERAVPEPDSDEMTHLLRFVGIQYGRTRAALASHGEHVTRYAQQVILTHPEFTEDLRETVDRIALEPPDGSVIIPLRVGNDAVPLLSDLRAKVLKCVATAEFVTSDAPVVLHNRWAGPGALGATAIMSAGLLVMLPLSPRHLLLLFDTDIYAVGPSADDYVATTDADEVAAINALQIEAASEAIFYSGSGMRAALDALRGAREPKRGWVGTTQPTERGTHLVITAKTSSTLQLKRGGAIRVREDVSTVPRRDRPQLMRAAAVELRDFMLKQDGDGRAGHVGSTARKTGRRWRR